MGPGYDTRNHAAIQWLLDRLSTGEQKNRGCLQTKGACPDLALAVTPHGLCVCATAFACSQPRPCCVCAGAVQAGAFNKAAAVTRQRHHAANHPWALHAILTRIQPFLGLAVSSSSAFNSSPTTSCACCSSTSLRPAGVSASFDGCRAAQRLASSMACV